MSKIDLVLSDDVLKQIEAAEKQMGKYTEKAKPAEPVIKPVEPVIQEAQPAIQPVVDTSKLAQEKTALVTTKDEAPKYVPTYKVKVAEKYDLSKISDYTIKYGGFAQARKKNDGEGSGYLDALVPYYNLTFPVPRRVAMLTGKTCFSKVRAKHVLGFSDQGAMKTVYFFNDEINCMAWDIVAMINMLVALESDVTIVKPNEFGQAGDVCSMFEFAVYKGNETADRFHCKINSYKGNNPMSSPFPRQEFQYMTLEQCMSINNFPLVSAVWKKFYYWMLLKCQDTTGLDQYLDNIDVSLGLCVRNEALRNDMNQKSNVIWNDPKSLKGKQLIDLMLTYMSPEMLIPDLYIKG